MMPSEPQTRDISSTAIAYASVSRPAPPSSSGIRDAEHAHRAQHGDDVGRETPLPLVLVDDRLDLVDGEIADRLAQQQVFGREVEVHGRWEPTRTPLAGVEGASRGASSLPERTSHRRQQDPVHELFGGAAIRDIEVGRLEGVHARRIEATSSDVARQRLGRLEDRSGHA